MNDNIGGDDKLDRILEVLEQFSCMEAQVNLSK